MNTVQPATIARISFATWARKSGLRKASAVTWYVPADVEVPARLMVGATVNGKPYTPPSTATAAPAKRRGRPPKPKPEDVEPEATAEPVAEPEIVPELEPEAPSTFQEEYR